MARFLEYARVLPGVLSAWAAHRERRPAIRLDDRRFLPGPNRFGTGPVASLRVALDAHESSDAVAGRLLAAASAIRARLGEDSASITLFAGKRLAAVGIACPNELRAKVILDHLVRKLSLIPQGEPLPTRAAYAALSSISEAPPPAHVPVAAITGTNGKSTTTRLLARIAREVGHTPGVTTSDGVWIGTQLALAGDYTGPQGAARALGAPEVTIGILEIARGGIALKGLGVPAVNVAVVTNVDADHLGLDGIDTVDELVSLKMAVVAAVKPGGACILNAADVHTPLMAAGSPVPVTLFGLDETTPLLAQHIETGGIAYANCDGWLVRIANGLAEPIIATDNIPITLGGIAQHNTENALAATAAAFALDIPLAAIQIGLRSFQSSPAENPGRLNLYHVEGRTVLLDFAHNPHGLRALLTVAETLAGDHRVLAVIGTAGDRRAEDLQALGEIAGQRCADVVVKGTVKYLRGRTLDELLALYLDGLERTGRNRAAIPVTVDEVTGFQAAFALSAPGDVIAIMCQEQRAQLWEMLGANNLYPESNASGPEVSEG